MNLSFTSGNNLQLTVNNINYCYDDFGDGNTALLFIHGFPFNKTMWAPQLESLKSAYRVIAYDIRGFGKSEGGEEIKSISQLADDLIHFMDALQLDSVACCGLSMGGYILLNAINRYPDRFKAIILSDTQCSADTAMGKEKRHQTIQQIEANGLEEFSKAFVKNIFSDTTLASKMPLVKSIQDVISRTTPASIVQTLKALAEREETCSTLKNISIPALVLCGMKDKITPLEKSHYLHQHIISSIKNEIPDAGHLSNLEQPDMFNQHLLNFLSSSIK